MKPVRIGKAQEVVNMKDASDTFYAERYEDILGEEGYVIVSRKDGKVVDAGSEKQLLNKGYRGYKK